jgi:hypothetical protein
MTRSPRGWASFTRPRESASEGRPWSSLVQNVMFAALGALGSVPWQRIAPLPDQRGERGRRGESGIAGPTFQRMLTRFGLERRADD